MTLQYLTKDPSSPVLLPNDWRVPGADPSQPPLPGGVAALAWRTLFTYTFPPGPSFFDFFFGGGMILEPWIQTPGARGRITGMVSLTNTSLVPIAPYFTLLFNGAALANALPSVFILLMPALAPGGAENYKFEIEFCFTEAGVVVLTYAHCTAVSTNTLVIPSLTSGPYTGPIVAGPAQTIAFRLVSADQATMIIGSFLAQLTAGQPLFNSF